MAGEEGDDSFAFLALEGSRYDAPGMPVENLPELSRYRDAIYAIARRLWLDDNGRSKVPDNFSGAFDLRVTHIKEGSAQPHLVLERDETIISDEDWDEWLPYWARARDLLTEGVEKVGAGADLPSAFPREAVSQAKRLGATLRPSERLRFGAPAPSSSRAVLDENVREVLRRIDEIVPPEPEVQTVDGVIIEFDSVRQQFRLRPTIAEQVIDCVLGPDSDTLARIAKDALAPDGVTAPDVRVTGLAIVATDGYFQKLTAVSAVEQVRSHREKVVMAQIETIRGLSDGWSGPSSLAPPAALVERVQALLPEMVAVGARVLVAPSTDGHLILEWRRGSVECTADLDGDAQMFLCADDTTTDELQETERPFDLGGLLRFAETGRWE